MTTATKNKTKDNHGVQMALQILEEGKRPMSPDQIKGKYQLELPFTIKRVIQGSNITAAVPCKNDTLAPGALITLLHYEADGFYRYLTKSCTCGGQHRLKADSERFVLADAP